MEKTRNQRECSLKQSGFCHLSTIQSAHELKVKMKIAVKTLLFVSILAVWIISCQGEKNEQSEECIRLGAMFIMSGPFEGYGQNAQQAINLALEEINGTGGILGKKLEVVYRDTWATPTEAIKKSTLIAEELITDERVNFLVGPTSSRVALAVSELAKKHKTILIVPQSATDELTGPQLHPYIFSTLSNAMMHARSGAHFAASKPYKRWMCIAPDYNYGHSSWRIFKERLLELKSDVEIVGESFSAFQKTKNYTPYIEDILKNEPDAVWAPLWGNEAVIFIRQGIEHDLFSKTKFFFPVGGALDVLVPLGKEMPKGLYMSSRYFFTTPDSDMNRSFVASYVSKFKEYPDYMAGEAYAGVYFIKAAAERAKSFDSDAIVRAVERKPLAWETPEGWKIMRSEDHSVVEDCIWGESGYSKEYGFAIITNIQSIQGEDICRTKEELRQLLTNKQ